jgi:hypothetical protein
MSPASNYWYMYGAGHITTPGTATVNSAGGYIYVNTDSLTPNFQVDSGITLQGSGGLSEYYSTNIVNAGTIGASASGSFSVYATSLTNNGTLKLLGLM